MHWGDQVAMGHYLHHNPTAWHEISDGWNYCIIFRNPRTYRIAPAGGSRASTERPSTSSMETAARSSPG